MDKLTLNQRVRGSNPLRLTWEELTLSPEGVAMSQKCVASPLDWLFYPDWLTVEQACYLSGWDAAFMQEIVDTCGVDLNHAGLIAKDSLWDFQETAALILHWND